MSAQQSIKKITSYLFLLRMFRMSLSVVTLIFSAKYFGVSMERDVWILVTTLLVTIGAAFWGPINDTFRAKFIFLKESEGEESAISKTLSLTVFILLSTLLVSLCIFLFGKKIALTMITSPTDVNTSLFISILFIMLPTLLINQLSAIGISILNAYDIFYTPEIVGAISALLNICIIVCLAPIIGIYSLAISQYVSILILLFTVFISIKHVHLFNWKSTFLIRFSDVKIFLLFSLPFFFPYFVGQCNALVEKWLAGWLGEGNISSLDYARQFTLVLQNVMNSILATVMVPMLAKAYMQKNCQHFVDILKENLAVCFAILSLILPILCGATNSLCEFFFFRGKISIEALDTIIYLTRFYSIAFIGILLYLISGCTLLASNKGKQCALWGVLTQVTILILNIAFISICDIYIFPVSIGVSHLLAAVIMSLKIDIPDRKVVYGRILKYSIIVIFMSGILEIFNCIVKLEQPLLQLFLNVLLVLLLFLTFSKEFNIDIKRSLLNILRR